MDGVLGKRPVWAACLGALLLAALLIRLAYIHRLDGFLTGDEAVGALMTLKIAGGHELPLVFWEAHYAGTLPFVLGALGFRLFEPSLAVLRITITLLSLVGLAAIASAARALWGPGAALAGALWLAAGPPLLFAYTAEVMNGYPEVLAFGGLTVWLGTRLARRPEHGTGGAWALFGAVAGFGAYGLLFVLPIFAGTVWALRRERGRASRRELALLGGGFLAGVSPFLIYNVIHPGASAVRLGARLFDVSRAEVAHASSLLALAGGKALTYLQGLVSYPATLLGNLPTALGLPGWGIWAAGAIVALVLARGGPRWSFGEGLVARCGLLLVIFVWLAELSAPRHLFAFYVLIPLGVAALWVRARGRLRVVVALGLALALAGNLVATTRDPNVGKPAVAELLGALDARGIRFVYTDYGIAYPLVFLSRERILASPAAGPTNVDRYPRYTRAVAASPSPAYVFLRGSEAGAVFAREMRRAGRPFSREAIGGFDLYRPERHVDPGELALLRKF